MNKIQTFSPLQLDVFRAAGAILHDCLQMLSEHVRIGITPIQLDAMAEEYIRSHKRALPAFKGYQGFPNTICASVNHYCVHTIPDNTPLAEGDIIKLDCGVLLEGLYTDACITVGVGELSESDTHLLSVTKHALDLVIPSIKANVQVGDLSAIIQTAVESQGLHLVRSLTGHGLGDDLHGEPTIANVGKKGTGPRLPANCVIAVEPIVCIGSAAIATDADGWGIYMKDGKNTAQFEHSIIVLENGYEVIT